MKWPIVGSVCGLIALTSVTSPAWADAVGPEFRVNNYTTGEQTLPGVAGLTGGGFVVIWRSYGQDGAEGGVYGQRYDSAGRRVGSTFRVNVRATGNQEPGAVLGLPGGGFVATWTDYGSDGISARVHGQCYDSVGKRLGTAFRIYGEHGIGGSAAGLKGGGFVVTWISYRPVGDDWVVFGRRYDSACKPLGNAFRVNSILQNGVSGGAVASLTGGGFVATWTYFGRDGSGWGVFGQRFDNVGRRVGKEFRVNSYTADDQLNSHVAGLTGGGFVVTWQSTGQDGSQEGIYGQRYDSAGRRTGREFRINSQTANLQAGPSVTGLKDGGLVVTWQSYGQDGSSAGVYGQRYDGAGKRVGGEFRVNTYTTGFQGLASIAGLTGGGFVVTWTSIGQDGDEDGIYGQRYTP